MARKDDNEGFIELYDLTKKQAMAKAPRRRSGSSREQASASSSQSAGQAIWVSYTVKNVEYFLGYDPSTDEPPRSLSRGIGRATLYVEPSK